MGSTTAAPAPAASDLPSLRRHAISRPMDASALLCEVLVARGVRTRPRAGQTLLRQGDPDLRLFLLEAGSVELSCVVESGRECLLDIVLPPEIFGGSTEATPFFAIAREECQVVSASSAELSICDPRVASAAMEISGHRALRFAERLRDALVLGTAERVMAVLSDLADRRSTRTPEGRRVDLSITQEDLARMTGCTRETVNRTMNRLSVERRLLRRGRRYVVPYAPTR
ncbi:MAG TPA: Crp/Fnr family transcriptional regulator [Actinomycetota bacterium]